jgi:hypothetical protein
MALSERDRRELHAAVELHLGSRAADLLLAMNEPELPFVLRGEMAELRGAMSALSSELRGEMAELRGEMSALSSELRAEMATLSTELRGEMAQLRTELRGEIAELRAETKAQLPKLMAANFGAMIGLAGLVVAAGALV